MRVLVTGGAGYVGSVVVEELLAAGHEVVAYDNLGTGHRDAVVEPARLVEGDILDGPRLTETLRGQRIAVVVHMAADSLVGESVADPARYYRTNVSGGLVLLDAMRAAGVRALVFSSTAAVYGSPDKQPIHEDDPVQPTNPYGETKLTFERALRWYEKAYDIRAVSLRYFNAAGATERNGERHAPETHLLPLVLQAVAGTREFVPVLGDDYPTPDGTCVRDYVHVADLAHAHVLAVDALTAGRPMTAVYNLGSGGTGASVREVLEAARRVTGREVPVRVGARRPGDPPALVASSDRARGELGWAPRYTRLEAIVESAWRWMQRAGTASASAQAESP
jgi:UDP-glucose 4-epimerase